MIIDLSSIKIGILIFPITYYILRNWKAVKKDDIDTIICSIEKNGVLKVISDLL
jgi:hypothetical protein